jgi:hypothetical protein
MWLLDLQQLWWVHTRDGGIVSGGGLANGVRSHRIAERRLRL